METAGTCGHCGAHSYFDELTKAKRIEKYDVEYYTWAVQCAACERMLIREEQRGPEGFYEMRQYPSAPARWSKFEDVPPHIASAASEAAACLSIGAYRAAGAMARATIEAVAKDKGVVRGNLAQKIETLEEQHLLRRGTAESAHEVRHFGNDMAHGDFAEDTSEEEASETLEFMHEVLVEVYEFPAKRARAKARREAAKAT
ncbi:DUF4145 domain-containing protein [Cellulosimicrobium sp. TH-20]|uniref:DUF4145 domain-containing protein n=1 Tax=Cellulosimicrobium sp. TH-20 TaxID=1980001 RepID=UPI001649EE1E